jgi:hypothetical protein
MASEKKYPVEITRDADGNEQAALNSAVCEAIASEDAFKDKPLSVIAAEYVRRAKAEDPDMDAAFQLQAFSLGASTHAVKHTCSLSSNSSNSSSR